MAVFCCFGWFVVVQLNGDRFVGVNQDLENITENGETVIWRGKSMKTLWLWHHLSSGSVRFEIFALFIGDGTLVRWR